VSSATTFTSEDRSTGCSTATCHPGNRQPERTMACRRRCRPGAVRRCSTTPPMTTSKDRSAEISVLQQHWPHLKPSTSQVVIVIISSTSPVVRHQAGGGRSNGSSCRSSRNSLAFVRFSLDRRRLVGYSCRVDVRRTAAAEVRPSVRPSRRPDALRCAPTVDGFTDSQTNSGRDYDVCSHH